MTDGRKSYTRNDTLGKQDNVAGRLILDWDATPDVKFSLNLNGWRNQDDAQAAQKDSLLAAKPGRDISRDRVSERTG
ncbi:hypothetical protein ACFSTD_20680 [Novosphingobium colocasiae]